MNIFVTFVLALAALVGFASEKVCGDLFCPRAIPVLFDRVVRHAATDVIPRVVTQTASTTEKVAQMVVAKAISTLSTLGHATSTIVSSQKTIIDMPGALRTTRTTISAQTLTREGVIEGTNYERVLQGAGALAENAKLDTASEVKLRDMFAHQYFAHVSPAGVGPADVVTNAGYAYLLTGENLALGNFEGDRGVITAWMNSPGHRANILKPGYREIGVAVGEGVFEGRKQWIAVQEFGTPRSACAVVDGTLGNLIQTSKAQIVATQAELDTQQTAIRAMSQDDPAYQPAVSAYNTLIASYNKLIIKTKELIDQYNAEVRAFNMCLDQY
ncbi:MAG: CAP domain-containing protein [Minisyncoccota bacterium]